MVNFGIVVLQMTEHPGRGLVGYSKHGVFDQQEDIIDTDTPLTFIGVEVQGRVARCNPADVR